MLERRDYTLVTVPLSETRLARGLCEVDCDSVDGASAGGSSSSMLERDVRGDVFGDESLLLSMLLSEVGVDERCLEWYSLLAVAILPRRCC